MMNLDDPRGFIVFDCDGTLISSELAIFKGLSILLSEFLDREVTEAEVQRKYVPDLSQLIVNFGLDVSEDTLLSNKMISRWHEISDSMDFRYDLFDGVKELLEALSKAGFLLYVWTGRDRKTTLEILKGLDVAQYFLDFRCVDDTTPKPHPQGVYEMLGDDLDRDRTFIIGDSFTDVRGAKEIGSHFIGAAWTIHMNPDALRREGAEILVDHPMDCLDIILKTIKE